MTNKPAFRIIVTILAIIGLFTILPSLFSVIPSLLVIAIAFVVGFLVRGMFDKKQNIYPKNTQQY